MPTITVEHTADGREIVYRVYIHPGVFSWFSVEQLIRALLDEFEEQLTTALYDLKEGVE
ncbi:hypothetical protein LCGC14_1808540 [marine sediment metagenome]|uniref:Uncharacterized protein n=1 Tax=marine sediment metagenome TaxID=412755 RepID=A0A0F9GMM3_9ZZZZ